jgi:hypothetical protein
LTRGFTGIVTWFWRSIPGIHLAPAQGRALFTLANVTRVLCYREGICLDSNIVVPVLRNAEFKFNRAERRHSCILLEMNRHGFAA